jgi:hypothetical protein
VLGPIGATRCDARRHCAPDVVGVLGEKKRSKGALSCQHATGAIGVCRETLPNTDDMPAHAG